MAKRFFCPAAALLLAAMAFAMVSSMLQESQTWDEGIHLAAGTSYWKTGRFRLNPEHPPLFKLLCALPVLALKPDLPTKSEAWAINDQGALGDLFLYRNRVPADTLLNWGRSVTVLETLLLGLALALWTRRKFGAGAALFALFLFAFDPNLIAHGRYVTNDLLMAATSFATLAAWGEYLERGSRRWLAATGAFLGLALVSKFSGVFLIAVLPVLWLLRHRRKPALEWRRGLAVLAIVLLLTAAVATAAYGPAGYEAVRTGSRLDKDLPHPETGVGQFLTWFSHDLPIPAHPYLVGFDAMSHYAIDHSQYLLGRVSMIASWYYFPVAFAVKTPTALLALTAVLLGFGVACGAAKLRRRGGAPAPFAWMTLAVPAAMYFAIVMTSSVALGIRYLLPVYPLLIVLVAAAVFHPALARARTWLLIAAVAVQAAESIRIYPDYLAFFNTLSGGPEAGPRYLADSNIDWGQDVKKLRRYLDRIGWKGPVCDMYFGRASWEYYGVPRSRAVPKTWEPKDDLDCLAAISVTPLLDVYVPPGSFQWLREKQPIAKVGYSIYVYDLRKKGAAP